MAAVEPVSRPGSARWVGDFRHRPSRGLLVWLLDPAEAVLVAGPRRWSDRLVESADWAGRHRGLRATARIEARGHVTKATDQLTF
jgi:hypothetical protein